MALYKDSEYDFIFPFWKTMPVSVGVLSFSM